MALNSFAPLADRRKFSGDHWHFFYSPPKLYLMGGRMQISPYAKSPSDICWPT